MINIPSDPYNIVVGPEMYSDILNMSIERGIREPAYVSSIISGVKLVVDPALSDGDYYIASDGNLWLPEAYREWERTESARDFNRSMFLDHYMARIPEPEPEPEFHDISIWERFGMGIFNPPPVANFMCADAETMIMSHKPAPLKWNFEF